jgi:hypothetical protein
MRRALLVLSIALLAPACSGENVSVPFAADLPAGARLRLHVRSGDIRILGTDEHKISVDVSGRNSDRARDLRVTLKERGGATDVRISGGPKNDIRLTIRIPRETDLYARIPFGEVHVENVRGDKDIELHAGDLIVQVGDAADYGHVDASVLAGDLDGRPFGENRGGLFRSFKKSGEGRHRLHAHVGAGDLTLE